MKDRMLVYRGCAMNERCLGAQQIAQKRTKKFVKNLKKVLDKWKVLC